MPSFAKAWLSSGTQSHGLSVESVARVGMEDLTVKYGIAAKNVNSIFALTVASSLVTKSKRIQE